MLPQQAKTKRKGNRNHNKKKTNERTINLKAQFKISYLILFALAAFETI